MIGRLQGPLLEKNLGRIIVDTNGVGYEVYVSVPTYSAMPDSGSQVCLNIYTHVREDSIQLYGFATQLEKTIFEQLTAISGIGPRLALTILSGSSVLDLITSIKKGNLARLTTIPGVGKKTAERILLELKDKLRDVVIDGSERGDNETDVISAMENLGYNKGTIEGAIKRILESDDDPGFDELFKRTLRILTEG